VTSNLRKVLMRLTHIFLLAAALCCAHPGYSLSRPFSGNASYYGKRLQGHRMANGRRYNRHALTAATRRLPLGSHARVTDSQVSQSYGHRSRPIQEASRHRSQRSGCSPVRHDAPGNRSRPCRPNEVKQPMVSAANRKVGQVPATLYSEIPN
jgi:hypothetical protein